MLASESAARLQEQAFEQGLLVNAPRPNVLRFMPSLLVSAEEIAEMSDILRRVWAAQRSAYTARSA